MNAGSARGPVRWHAGEDAVRRAIETWLASPPPATLLRDNPRRVIARVTGRDGRSLLVKRFRSRSGRHPWRERVKAWLGFAPAAREWRALRALHAAGAPVPEPLAWGTLADGDPLLVLRFVEGPMLADSLAASTRRGRRDTLVALGRAVRALHGAGWCHGDLHHGNVLVGAHGAPLLLDLQHARRGTGRRRDAAARTRDLGFLDYALSTLVSRSDRLRVARAALPDASDGRALRAAAEASRARADAHARSRTRRSLRPGRAYAVYRRDGARGLRVRDVPAERIDAYLAAHETARTAGPPAPPGPQTARVLKRDRRSCVSAVSADGQSVVVKEIAPRGMGRPLADLLRGSAARRAWTGGHGLRARGIGAARPLAFLERRRLGVPVASWLVLEDVSPARPADAFEAAPAAERDAVVDALGRLAIALHRRGADHGDLKASHVFLAPSPTGFSATLIDLEGVRFPRRGISERDRVLALAQLNASLSDSFAAPARCRAFARYARALPFSTGASESRVAVVRESLARRHRWSGAGCIESGSPVGEDASRIRPA